MTKKIISTLIGLLAICTLQAQYMFKPLSPDAKISLVVSGSSDLAIYTQWGHAAIRVYSPNDFIDITYNYGVFSFDDSFIYKFVKGETDYCLGAYSYNAMYKETIYKNADLYEMELNLTESERNRLYWNLVQNAMPENRTYRYRFFFDNCATRPRDMVEKSIEGNIVFEKDSANAKLLTYRDYIHNLLKTARWYEFGINMCLGKPTDDSVHYYERMFLPMELKYAFEHATIVGKDGSIRPLVVSTKQTLKHGDVQKKKELFDILTPDLLFWIILVLSIAHAAFYIKTGKDDRWVYLGLHSLLGLFGCLLFFLAFISVHDCVYPNYSLLWCSPLHWIIAALIYIKKAQKAENILQGLNVVLNIAALMVPVIGLQTFDTAFIPIILMEIVMSGSWLYRKVYKAKK